MHQQTALHTVHINIGMALASLETIYINFLCSKHTQHNQIAKHAAHSIDNMYWCFYGTVNSDRHRQDTHVLLECLFYLSLFQYDDDNYLLFFVSCYFNCGFILL